MRDGELEDHILKQYGRESSLACLFLVTHRREVCMYSLEGAEISW